MLCRPVTKRLALEVDPRAHQTHLHRGPDRTRSGKRTREKARSLFPLFFGFYLLPVGLTVWTGVGEALFEATLRESRRVGVERFDA